MQRNRQDQLVQGSRLGTQDEFVNLEYGAMLDIALAASGFVAYPDWERLRLLEEVEGEWKFVDGLVHPTLAREQFAVEMTAGL